MNRLSDDQIARKHALADELADRAEALGMAVAAYNTALAARHAAVIEAWQRHNETIEKADRFAAEVCDDIESSEELPPSARRAWAREWGEPDFEQPDEPDEPEEIAPPDCCLEADELRDLPDAPEGC